MRLFQRCADAGHPAALSLYGHMLFHRSRAPQDKARGARYVLQAAHGGDARAQYQAGQIHENGCALYPARHDHAVTWYARAGEAVMRWPPRVLSGPTAMESCRCLLIGSALTTGHPWPAPARRRRQATVETMSLPLRWTKQKASSDTRVI